MSDVQAIFLTRKCWNVQAFLDYITPTLEILGTFLDFETRVSSIPEVLPKKVPSQKSVSYLQSLGQKLLLSKT